MKIKKILISIIILLCAVFVFSKNNPLTSLAKSSKGSISEEQYIRTLQLLLYPYINEEVHTRYGEYTYVDIYDINFKSIKIQSPIKITITVIIKPYTGAHNTISTDKVTLHVDDKNVKIINYIIDGS